MNETHGCRDAFGLEACVSSMFVHSQLGRMHGPLR